MKEKVEIGGKSTLGDQHDQSNLKMGDEGRVNMSATLFLPLIDSVFSFSMVSPSVSTIGAMSA
jgi:hypothetical protein